jgi:lipoate-protein ligase A
VLQSISEHCAIQLKEANEEMLADLYAPDVAAARVIEIAVSASMSSLKNLSQNDPNMIKVLEKLVKQLLSALARIL